MGQPLTPHFLLLTPYGTYKLVTTIAFTINVECEQEVTQWS